MEETIFHKMAKGEIVPKDVVYEDDRVLAFRDIHPVAPVHIVIIPKKEIASVAGMVEEDKEVLGHIIWVTHVLAEQEGIAESGYRIVTNSGEDSTREVEYLHFHLIGGKRLGSKIG
ncbi:MAG: histidine triad nucleotide-binding protein [Candidatus Moranbacteria bacterium]|nr:histidine triad nucleotide-binding protein [Candidatus Moranbacteria bacterium]